MPVPPPDGAIVADADKDAAVLGEAGLADGGGALGVRQHRVTHVRRVLHVKVPQVRLPNLPKTHNQASLLLVAVYYTDTLSLRQLYCFPPADGPTVKDMVKVLNVKSPFLQGGTWLSPPKGYHKS